MRDLVAIDIATSTPTMTRPVIAIATSTPMSSTNSTNGDSGFDNGYNAPTGNEGGASGSDQGNRGISTGAMSAIIVVVVLVVLLGGKEMNSGPKKSISANTNTSGVYRPLDSRKETTVGDPKELDPSLQEVDRPGSNKGGRSEEVAPSGFCHDSIAPSGGSQGHGERNGHESCSDH